MRRRIALRKRGRSDWAAALVLISPAAVIYGLYTLYGIARTFSYSMLNWTGMGAPGSAPYIGLANYARLLKDAHFWHALQNNLLLVVVSVVVQLGLGMALALIINSPAKGSRVFRTIYFMPLLLSTVATGILWQLLYDPYSGPLNGALKNLFPKEQLSWLGSESVVMFAVLFVICWQYTPQYMILLRAGMTSIPEELYEAAVIDGASLSERFWHITLPMLSGTIKTAAVLSIVGSLKYFDLVWIMTAGGPNGYSELMATYMYKKAFSDDMMGYASTIASCMVLISLAVIVAFQSMTRAREEESR